MSGQNSSYPQVFRTEKHQQSSITRNSKFEEFFCGKILVPCMVSTKIHARIIYSSMYHEVEEWNDLSPSDTQQALSLRNSPHEARQCPFKEKQKKYIVSHSKQGIRSIQTELSTKDCRWMWYHTDRRRSSTYGAQCLGEMDMNGSCGDISAAFIRS